MVWGTGVWAVRDGPVGTRVSFLVLHPPFFFHGEHGHALISVYSTIDPLPQLWFPL